jgi:hypothetical protein
MDGPNQEDLLLLGQISVVLKNEKQLQSPFAARITLSYAGGGKPKVRMYQAIVVSIIACMRYFQHILLMTP